MIKKECDVVVVAAGPSGLAAAVTLCEQGLHPIVLEKAGVVGGTANMGMGPFGVESRIQKANMVGLRKEEAFRLFMEYNHWRVDARKVREYIWKSGETIDWLENMGVQFAVPARYFPSGFATWHPVIPEGGGKPRPRCASAMNRTMYERAKEMGAEFLFNTPARELIMENGAAVGVKAVNTENEEEYEIRGKAVLVATGGFGDNPEMIREYCGYEYGDDMINTRVPGVAGDGIRMVWAVGGKHGRMQMEKTMGSKIENRTMMHLFQQPATIMVNLDGVRVADEAVIENYSVMSNVCDIQPKRRIISILDDRIVKHYHINGVDFPSGVHQGDPTEGFDEAFEEAVKQWPEDAFTAGSVRELAEKIGIDPDTLEETFEEYNDMCAEHEDEYFCKDRRYLVPFKGKKLYAAILRQSGYGSLGGIEVNYKFEVIGEDGKTIPGLYASGTDTCDIYSDTYYFYLPGNTMGYALNSGRLAAEHIGEYLEA